jgi:hypothetical protein
MPYSIEKIPGLIKVTYWGTLNKEDVLGVIDHSFNGKVTDNSDRIEDMRNLHSVQTGYADLIEVTKQLHGLQLPRTVKTALLTSNALQYGVARMFQSILDHPQMKLEIFTNEKEAMNWLQQPR